MPVAEICRKAGISQATYFSWKMKYDGLLPTEMRRLKQLEDENVNEAAHRFLARQRDAAGHHPRKAMKAGRKRKLVDEVRSEWQVSICRICAALEFDRSTDHYESRRSGKAALERNSVAGQPRHTMCTSALSRAQRRMTTFSIRQRKSALR